MGNLRAVGVLPLFPAAREKPPPVASLSKCMRDVAEQKNDTLATNTTAEIRREN